jgi:DNA-binding GntR family transcriptional regulator
LIFENIKSFLIWISGVDSALRISQGNGDLKTNLSEYIRDDLRARVLTGNCEPERLTLPAIAEQYQVSQMPVRLAIQELLKENVLQRQDNGRLRANPSKFGSQKKEAGKGKVPQPTPPKDVFDQVLTDVLRFSLLGESREMKIIPCAEHYAMSQSQMHAIFHRLAGLGVMEHAPRRGWSVRPFKVSDLDAYLTVREAMELLALDLARERLAPAKLKELLELNRPLPERGAISIDNSLHRYWVEVSENRYIQDFFLRHQMFYDVLLSHVVLKRDLIDASRESHCRILEAMLRRDWTQARAELIQDIRYLGPLLKQTVQRLESGQKVAKRPKVDIKL